MGQGEVVVMTMGMEGWKRISLIIVLLSILELKGNVEVGCHCMQGFSFKGYHKWKALRRSGACSRSCADIQEVSSSVPS